ncbi:MAG: leucyl/phenylalanyl-tRNA--protein transferase [Pirellulaceae bacterium]|jgi:leucyl/phenylalanyl-tRNA--protein transferase|nr:leucyl/phenylalanyl-tRNA--protein transferase [Pirellulaceae bacterium]
MSVSGNEDDFPPVWQTDADGLVALGGRLTPARVLQAYRRGIFPWPLGAAGGKILAWFSPDPRAVIEFDAVYVSRRLARRIRSGCFQLTCDRAFADVIAACAAPRGRESDTWITPEIRRVYGELHLAGHAHSLEVWQADALVGGIYGVALGGFFAGESMFHGVTDASKVALVALVAHLATRGYSLFDIQQATAHALRMGAHEIPRRQFLARLERAVAQPVTFGTRLELERLPALIRRAAQDEA